VAPEWETAPCSTADCQERVSACMLAHVNASGVHIPLWLDGNLPGIQWGSSADYPYQEGGFFGNIFSSPPKAFYCDGADFQHGTVPGRLGATSSSIYTNPFGTSGFCGGPCQSHGTDGFTSCFAQNYTFTHVATTSRR